MEFSQYQLLCLVLLGHNNESSQNHPDSEPSPEGRSIGHVRDKSAPTIVRIHLLICINWTPAVMHQTIGRGRPGVILSGAHWRQVKPGSQALCKRREVLKRVERLGMEQPPRTL